jgi:hypothetical protein
MLIPEPPARAWVLLSDDARTLRVAGAMVQTPRPAAHVLIVSLNAAQHGASEPRPLEDLRRMITRVDPGTWEEAATLAAALGAGSAMREGLRWVVGGGELADRLALADEATPAVRLLGASAPVTAMGLHQVLATRGVRARLRLIARKLVPTPAFMRLWRPLASRGRLGLTVAYVWRPLWLVAKLPRGIVALIAVARGGGTSPAAVMPAAWWALGAWIRCRVQLRRGGLGAVRLPAPPAERPGAEAGVRRVLAGVRASCLEAALVWQRWHAGHGRPRDVVIGVRGPSARFGAHAWLDGDAADAQAFQELSRWPAPDAR